MAAITRVVDTPIGPCMLEWSHGLSRVRIGASAADGGAARVGDPTPLAEVADLLRAYFEGDAVDFSSVALDRSGVSPADGAIYDALRMVGYGDTTTYGELASRAGLPGAARAVGSAMARNPWPIVVPCHRVLASGGKLGGFSAPGGSQTKRWLLELEGADLEHGTPMLPGLFDEG